MEAVPDSTHISADPLMRPLMPSRLSSPFSLQGDKPTLEPTKQEVSPPPFPREAPDTLIMPNSPSKTSGRLGTYLQVEPTSGRPKVTKSYVQGLRQLSAVPPFTASSASFRFSWAWRLLEKQAYFLVQSFGLLAGAAGVGM